MDPGRLLGGTDSAPGQPQVPTDAFRCPRRLERHKRPKSMSGTHSKNDSDHTGSQPRSSVIVHRSSFIVRSSVRSLLIRRTESSCFKLSIVYLAGILRSYAPTLLRSLRPRVSTYLPIAHPSAADIATLQSVSTSVHQRSTGLSWYG